MNQTQEYNAGVKSIFKMLAPFYDAIALPLLRVRRQVVALTTARSGTRVLDIATGTGAQAFAFAKQGCKVTGIDLSEAMIGVARRKNRYANLNFEVGDATSLPFDDGSFDISIISFALHMMPLSISEKVLNEMNRVTRPGGNIVIADLALPKSGMSRFLIYHLFRLYDDRHYQAFLKLGLEELLKKTIKIDQEISMLFGGVRIIKGTGLLKEQLSAQSEYLWHQEPTC